LKSSKIVVAASVQRIAAGIGDAGNVVSDCADNVQGLCRFGDKPGEDHNTGVAMPRRRPAPPLRGADQEWFSLSCFFDAGRPASDPKQPFLRNHWL